MKHIRFLWLLAFSFMAVHGASPSFQNLLWTNLNGTITAKSQVADGASAVAFRMNSSNTLSDGHLLELQNHGTNWLTFGLSGSDVLFAFGRDVDAATTGGYGVTLTPKDLTLRGHLTESDIRATLAANATQGEVTEVIKDISNGRSYYQSMYQYLDSTNIYPVLAFYQGTRRFVLLDPARDFFLDVNYIFNTTDTVSSGNLVEVQNNGSNVFTIDYLGVISGLGGPTQPVIINYVTIEQNITVKGNSTLNVVTANSVTSSNTTTLLGTATLNGSGIATQVDILATQSGTHASPSTTDPLSPTWTGPLRTVWYGATGQINLPAAAGYTGKALLIYNTGSFTITVEPNGSEVIVRDGTVQTGGVSFTLSSGAGNYVTLFCDGVRWVTLGYKGTLTVGT